MFLPSPQGSAKYFPLLAWNHVVIEHRSGGKTYTTTDAVRREGQRQEGGRKEGMN